MAKRPEPAPSGALSPQAAAALVEMLSTGRSGLPELIRKANRDYLYWDRFKHQKMPAGIHPEDAWRFLKAMRGAERRRTPVKDTHGDPFTFSLTDEVHRCLHEIDMQAGGPVTAAGVIPRHDERRYLVSSLMEEAIASSQIEGASTTRRRAKDMLREGRPAHNISERMILNNYETIARLKELKEEPLTPSLIVQIQAWLTEGTLGRPEDVGTVRSTDDIYVHDARTTTVLHVPPAASRIPAELARLCAYANDDSGAFERPALKASVLHFWLGYLHPFADGNGRTARALFYLYMLKKGYWLFEYLSISRIILGKRGQYDRAYLYAEADECDLTYFLNFHLHAVLDALQSLWEYLQRKQAEDRDVAARLRHDRTLNHRQQSLLERALRDDAVVFTIGSHQRSHDVSYPTARKDLLELAERGYLEQAKAGKAFVFRPAEGLPSRLSSA